MSVPVSVANVPAGMDDPFQLLIDQLRDAVLRGPGALDLEGRRAAYEGRGAGPLGDYVAKVTAKAYAVTDQDVAALRVAGYAEDEIFEATVCAALGAGLTRLERGLVAFGREAP